jgi:Ca2+-binding RTX toxin-like protein
VWGVEGESDQIFGGSGNNLIWVGGSSASVAQVNGGTGNDTINGQLDQGILYVAPGTGTGVNVVVGDDFSNHIYGNNNNGTLYERGGRGQDELIGGHGNNHFIMTSGGDFVQGGGTSNAYLFNDLSAGNTHLNNFNTATDVIGINANNFAGLFGGETLTLGFNLINGTSSVANTATFLYNAGALYFDADGTGAASAPVAVAGLVNTPAALTPNNFFISGTAF